MLSEKTTKQLVSDALARATIEVSTRQANVETLLSGHFKPGTGVNIAYLPDDERAKAVDVAVRVARAGFVPIPHIPARGFTSSAELTDFIARLNGEAGVKGVLLIAGDIDPQKGPFSSSMDILKTGILEKHGVQKIWFAGHPEGHPKVTQDVMDEALFAKLNLARASGMKAGIITQFVFEAQPIRDFVSKLKAKGFDVSIRAGVAGPASTTTLIKYAMRCGVGNSLRALRSQGARLTKLMGDTRPDELIADIFSGPAGTHPASFHLYIFGGLEKTGKWLDEIQAQCTPTSD